MRHKQRCQRNNNIDTRVPACPANAAKPKPAAARTARRTLHGARYPEQKHTPGTARHGGHRLVQGTARRREHRAAQHDALRTSPNTTSTARHLPPQRALPDAPPSPAPPAAATAPAPYGTDRPAPRALRRKAHCPARHRIFRRRSRNRKLIASGAAALPRRRSLVQAPAASFYRKSPQQDDKSEKP